MRAWCILAGFSGGVVVKTLEPRGAGINSKRVMWDRERERLVMSVTGTGLLAEKLNYSLMD